MTAAFEKLDSYTYMEGQKGLTGMLDYYDVNIVAGKAAEDENGLRAEIMLAFWFEYASDRNKIVRRVKETLSPSYPDIFCTIDGDTLVIETKTIG